MPAIPKPGTEFEFHVSDIGYAAAALLGEGWRAKAHDFGAGSTIKGSYATEFDLHTDRDLAIGYTRYGGDRFPGREERELPRASATVTPGCTCRTRSPATAWTCSPAASPVPSAT
ncbi:hypothetical protein [Streptomyces sp. NPDC001165]|uniref:hypothetical protein n=1 Tax=Streptomyces sp. NPDC001165 TaxID=3364546 RepID=UPI0036A46553